MDMLLPLDLEQFIQAKVQSGRFSSSDEAITAALRLLRQQEEAEDARTLEGIRQGFEDMRAGRGRPADEVFADLRREFNLLWFSCVPFNASNPNYDADPGPVPFGF